MSLSFMAAETLDAPCLRPSPAILASLVEGTGQLRPPSWGTPPRVPPGVGVLRLRRRTLRRRDARVRLVDALGGLAPPRRARDLRAMAVGHRQLVAGRDSGKSACSARCRSRARRSSAIGSASAACSLTIAFVVQAVIFGAGHAPYPTQPSFARPVELIIPSIGFGLLYVYFGLLPGHRSALRVRRRLVRAPDLPVGCAGHLAAEGHGHPDDVRTALGRAVATPAGRRLDHARGGRQERGVDATNRGRAGRRRAGHRRSRTQSSGDARVAGDRRHQRRRVHLGRGAPGSRRHVRHHPQRGRHHRSRRGRGARRNARSAVASDAGARSGVRRSTRVRLGHLWRGTTTTTRRQVPA